MTIHPDFVVLALANRPGFPFLGNDFIRECGTVFATHVVESPDAASQLALMTAEGPSVPVHVHRRLVRARRSPCRCRIPLRSAGSQRKLSWLCDPATGAWM